MQLNDFVNMFIEPVQGLILKKHPHNIFQDLFNVKVRKAGLELSIRNTNKDILMKLMGAINDGG